MKASRVVWFLFARRSVNQVALAALCDPKSHMRRLWDLLGCTAVPKVLRQDIKRFIEQQRRALSAKDVSTFESRVLPKLTAFVRAHQQCYGLQL